MNQRIQSQNPLTGEYILIDNGKVIAHNCVPFKDVPFHEKPTPVKTQTDLFSETHIQVPNNIVLENACNRLLALYQERPDLFDGETRGEVDRKVFAEILWRDGLQRIIPSDKKEEYFKIFMKAPEGEVITRAIRHLFSEGLIPISRKLILAGERMRARIAGAMHNG
jgi:hypothetical protein